MKIPAFPILFGIIAVVIGSSVAAYGVVNTTDDLVVNDQTNLDGTAFVVETLNGEATFLFVQQTTGDAWRLRIQPASEGLSIVKETGGFPGEKVRFLENGDILTTGNIIPAGDICIGACP